MLLPLADEACTRKQAGADAERDDEEMQEGDGTNESEGVPPEVEQAEGEGVQSDANGADQRPDFKCGFVKGQWPHEEDEKVGLCVVAPALPCPVKLLCPNLY